MPIAQFKPPDGPRDRDRRRVHRAQARPVHDEDGQGATSCRAPSRRRRRRSASAAEIDEASGLLWQDGCAGPEGHPGLLQPPRGRSQLPELAEGQRRRGAPARRAGSGVRGGPKGTRTVVLLQRRVRPVRPDLGRAVLPRPSSARCTPPPVVLRSVRHARIRSRPVRRPASPPTDPVEDRRDAPTPFRHAEAAQARAADRRGDSAGRVRARRSSPRRRPRRARPGGST